MVKARTIRRLTIDKRWDVFTRAMNAHIALNERCAALKAKATQPTTSQHEPGGELRSPSAPLNFRSTRVKQPATQSAHTAFLLGKCAVAIGSHLLTRRQCDTSTAALAATATRFAKVKWPRNSPSTRHPDTPTSSQEVRNHCGV